MTKTVAIVGAGIVGVSTAVWLQREGHRVVLIDQRGPGEGTSHGNGGVLASASVVPVPVPGLWKMAPRMLFDPRQPLFLKWGYLPRLMPWLLRYMRHATVEGVASRARAIAPIIGDSLNDHLALAEGTGAERFVVPSDYLYVYPTRRQFEADAAYWQVRREAGWDWDVLEDEEFTAYDPCFGPDLRCAVRLGGHGRISDPGAYVKALAAHVERSHAVVIAEGIDSEERLMAAQTIGAAYGMGMLFPPVDDPERIIDGEFDPLPDVPVWSTPDPGLSTPYLTAS